MKKYFLILILLTLALFSVSAFDDNSTVIIGERVKLGDNLYKVPVVVSSDMKSFCIGVSDATFKLTSVSGSGYYFRDGSTSSMSSTGSANTTDTYYKITLVADNKQAAETAFKTICYSITGSTPTITIEGLDFSIQSQDVFLNGHIYRLSDSVMSFTDAVNWAFSQGGYPVTITSEDENKVAFVFFKKLNSGLISGYNSNGYKLFWIGAVPNPNNHAGDGSITFEKNSSNVYQMTINGEIGANTSLTGRGYVWMTGTPEAGNTVPTSYWCSGQPDSGSIIVYGHLWNGVDGAGKSWDDSGGSFSNTDQYYGCAEIQPETKVFSKDLSHEHDWSVSIDGSKLILSCNSGTCAGKDISTTLELKAEEKTYVGTAFSKKDILSSTNFSDFNLIAGTEFDYDSVKIYNVNDKNKTDLSTLVEGRYKAELSFKDKKASFDIEVKHPHTWVYKLTGDRELSAYCTKNSNGYQCDYYGKKNALKLAFSLNNDFILVPTINPNNATRKDVSWTSSNPEYVTVDQSGLVKAIKKTENPIRITAISNDETNKVNYCYVTVVEPE